jgi:hypothetical protein
VIRSTNSAFCLIGILLSTYSVPNTHNLPKSYLTATANCYSRSVLPNSYLIIHNTPNKVQNRGILHVLSEFLDEQKVDTKVVRSQTPNRYLKCT